MPACVGISDPAYYACRFWAADLVQMRKRVPLNRAAHIDACAMPDESQIVDALSGLSAADSGVT